MGRAGSEVVMRSMVIESDMNSNADFYEAILYTKQRRPTVRLE